MQWGICPGLVVRMSTLPSIQNASGGEMEIPQREKAGVKKGAGFVVTKIFNFYGLSSYVKEYG